ncbi:MAG TPA: hypothetical protein PLY93_06525 [Turneriella sp.]|nr:hypothetical protein [Turneriella sp.]
MKRALLLFLVLTFGVAAKTPFNTKTVGRKNYAAILAAKAFAWLAANQDEKTFGIDVVLLYTFTMHKFNSPDLSITHLVREKARRGYYSSKEGSPFLHVISPLEGTPLQVSERINIDAMTSTALWCDRKQPFDGYLDKLRSMGRMGKYELTHMYWAILMMKEKECAFFQGNQSALEALEKEFVRDLHALVARGAVDDLTIEATTFLYYGSAATKATEDYLIGILPAMERAFDNAKTTRLSAHTVALFYWGLLEYLNPDLPRVPLAVRFRVGMGTVRHDNRKI